MNNISATRWSTFERCPLEYRFKYIDQLLAFKGEALVIGSLYHKMLELYHSGREVEAEKIPKDNKEHSAILTHLFAKYLARPVLGDVLETEYRFDINVPGVGIPLIGYLDRVDADKGVEYKTASKKWHEADTDTIQTKMYLYALLRRFGRPMPIVYSVNNKKTKVLPEIIPVERTEAEILMLEDEVKIFIKDVDNSSFDPTPSGHCYMCAWGNKGDGTCPYSN